MDIDEFRGIVTAFADTPASIDLSKGDLILQMHDDLIEARLEFSNGHDICVVENDTKYTAREWVLKRLARLPLLAERILAYVSQESNFVTPRGLLLDQLELQPEENETDVSDALEETRRMLGASIPGASSILYLTSDAGEGKTTLINQLARDQAMLYKLLFYLIYMGLGLFLKQRIQSFRLFCISYIRLYKNCPFTNFFNFFYQSETFFFIYIIYGYISAILSKHKSHNMTDTTTGPGYNGYPV